MKRKRSSTKDADGYSNASTEATAAFSRVDEPTLLYFKEIRAHLDEADEGQRGILASNALSEANGGCLVTCTRFYKLFLQPSANLQRLLICNTRHTFHF